MLQMEPPIVEHLLLLYFACLPNMVVMAPFDEAELMHMVATAAVVDDRQTQLLQVSKGNGVEQLFLLITREHLLRLA